MANAPNSHPTPDFPTFSALFALDIAYWLQQTNGMAKSPWFSHAKSGLSPSGFAALSVDPAAILGLALALTLAAAPSPAQSPATRAVYVSVSDAQGRVVTGLDRSHFEVVENGIARAITAFTGGEYAMAVAVISPEPLISSSPLRLGDVLIQTSTLSDAIAQLQASGDTRKIVVAASLPEGQPVPGGIQFVQADPAELSRTILRLRNQYRLEFDSSLPSAEVEIVLDQPRALPPLKAEWR